MRNVSFRTAKRCPRFCGLCVSLGPETNRTWLRSGLVLRDATNATCLEVGACRSRTQERSLEAAAPQNEVLDVHPTSRKKLRTRAGKPLKSLARANLCARVRA